MTGELRRTAARAADRASTGRDRLLGTRRRSRRPPRHAPRMPFALLVTLLVLGAMALLLGLNTLSAANEVQRHTFATRDQAVAAQVEQLRMEVDDSAAPANLASAAAALGMVPAGNPAFIVDVAGRLIVRGRALPATYPVVPPPTSSSAKATKPAKPSTTPTSKKSPTTSRNSTTTSAANPPSKSPSRSASASSSHKAPEPPTPTPTPTPTVTLPGGPR